MRLTFLIISLLVPLAAGAQAPSGVMDRGVRAEAEGRWDDALNLYRAELQRDPRQPDLWVRVADIDARLGRRDDCINALTRAAAVAPTSASIHVRLSEAHAEAGHVDAAFLAIERAVALAPRSSDYLRRRGALAAWAGDYGRAKDSYRRLVQLVPEDADALLGLARTSGWAGDTDSSVAAYRKYLRLRPEVRDAWIELARAESWRGNYAEALDVLGEFRRRFGDSPEYVRERIAVLARGGRPREATRLIERVLPATPDDYGLHLSKSVALAAQQRRDALAALETAQRLRPGDPQNGDVRSVVRVALASTGIPHGSFYSDSDGLSTWRIDPRLNLALGGGTRFDAGYDRTELRARAGSGLEGGDGTLDARHEITWIGLSQRAGHVTLQGQGGYAAVEDRSRTSYLFAAHFDSDRLRLSAARESAFFVLSPRTILLGLTRLTHRVGLDWTPGLRYDVSLDGTYDELSDGNRRWDATAGWRRVFARTEKLNLDLGVQARHFGTTRDLDNGYYDPSRYENYSFVAFPYWKVSENNGVGGVLALGVQRDDRSRSFGFAGNAVIEGSFGIYRDWMLKVNGSVTVNDRLQSGAFRGYSGQLAVVRRF
jgi:tetratricopeptide (TPR) repeat protein